MRRIERHRAGFTLVELLVALAVFALMVLALLNLAGESVRSAVAVEQRALAAVVADNQAVQAALLPAAEAANGAAGVERAGDRDWPWERHARPLEGGLLRIGIVVRAQHDGQVLAERELLRDAAP